jgi:hypothetical protein
MMKSNGFGQRPGSPLWARLEENLSLVARGDVGVRIGLLSRIVRTPLVDGWLVGRATASVSEPGDFSLELLYTPSASGWIDWYVGGPGFFYDQAQPDESFWDRFDFRPEIGAKFRVRVEYRGRRLGWFGFRLGLRVERLEDYVRLDAKRSGVSGLSGVRFVWEVGGGAW